jgi:hypothetical protein
LPSTFKNREKRIIVFDSEFIQLLDFKRNNDWSSISILAHEIGHHLCGHTIPTDGNLEKRRNEELQADEFSGHILKLLGANLSDAQKAVRSISSNDDDRNSTHPNLSKRLRAIEKGYNRISADFNITRDYNSSDVYEYKLLSNIYKFDYDIIGDVKKVGAREITNPNNFTNYEFNSLNQLTKRTRYNNNELAYTHSMIYDEHGKLIEVNIYNIYLSMANKENSNNRIRTYIYNQQTGLLEHIKIDGKYALSFQRSNEEIAVLAINSGVRITSRYLMNNTLLVTEYSDTNEILEQETYNESGDCTSKYVKQGGYGPYKTTYKYLNGKLIEEYTEYYGSANITQIPTELTSKRLYFHNDGITEYREYDLAGNLKNSNRFSPKKKQADSNGNIIQDDLYTYRYIYR